MSLGTLYAADASELLTTLRAKRLLERVPVLDYGRSMARRVPEVPS